MGHDRAETLGRLEHGPIEAGGGEGVETATREQQDQEHFQPAHWEYRTATGRAKRPVAISVQPAARSTYGSISITASSCSSKRDGGGASAGTRRCSCSSDN